MRGLFYRLSNIPDPEERLEDACLWKAMSDHYGDGISLWPDGQPLPADGVVFGRTRRFEDTSPFAGVGQVIYAKDPAFLAGISREFWLCDLEEAGKRVRDLHARGKSAFVKATDQKRMILRLAPGANFNAAMGDDVWSFMDRPPCLMVQEHVNMRCERRFVVMDRKIVTESPVAPHLTPLSRHELEADYEVPVDALHFSSPSDRIALADPRLSARMRDLVMRTAENADQPNLIIDVCVLDNGKVELIEFNPCRPGMFGLFACDPRAIAAASRTFIPDDLLVEVERRQREADPLIVPEKGTGPIPEPADGEEEPWMDP